jgi:uncharacterized protein YacL
VGQEVFLMLRIGLILLFAIGGYLIGSKIEQPLLGVIGGMIGASLLILGEVYIARIPIKILITALIGLVSGLILGNILFLSFIFLTGVRGPFLLYGYMLGTLFLGYMGLVVGIKRSEEIVELSSFLSMKGREGKERIPRSIKILDTSVIIDGRIADICEAGFVEGTLVIPRFILRELQKIADSSDQLKRNRGRRGLDVLNRMQKKINIDVQIHDTDFPDLRDVDTKLVKLAKLLQAKIITNDYNLNKIAELEGISVLNVNELAESLKPVILPGEELTIHIVKEGKEFGQGVAYLDDGTMVVVDNGKGHIGEKVQVAVTSVLQTTGGRMIFTKLK